MTLADASAAAASCEQARTTLATYQDLAGRFAGW
jgi:hypothetical protein